MNILQIGSYLPPDTPGGAEISARNVAAALSDAGHHIVRLRWKPSGTKALIGSVERTDPGQWVGTTWRPYTPLETRGGLDKVVFYGMELAAPLRSDALDIIQQQENIEAIIIHSFRGFGYDLLRKVSRLNLPTVIFLHDYALTCMNKGRFRRSRTCQSLCAECKVATFANHHTLKKISQLTFIGPSNKIVQDTCSDLQIGHASFIHIPNPNQYILSPRTRQAQDVLTLAYVGRLEPEKGVGALLEIADQLHERHAVRFIIAGAGDLAGTVQEFADKREWVSFRGFVPPNRMVEVYEEIDVLLVPSLWPENFPGVLVQALGNGIPAIGFDTGGIPEIIKHGRTGLVVPVGNLDLLSNAVSKLVNQPNLFESMSRASIEAYQEYDPVTLRKRIVAAIESTVAGALVTVSG